MNADRFRLVFNATRGQPMAVAETAAAQGRGSAPAPGRRRAAGPAWVAVRSLCLAVWLGLGQVAWLPAAAQIVADPGAPATQRATVLNAANGVPLVNIQTPNAAGVSHNTYRQFDVQRPGAILNNSRSAVQTQQGGWVQANPWLATGSARVILNEVRSSDPSLLRGYIEVAGQRAQVVIANPAGVSCDGCGFVNASRATLATGTPQLGAAGGLEAFLVRGGQVRIEGDGLDVAGSDYTELLARAVQVNAGVWAQRLRVSTGAARIGLDGQGEPVSATAMPDAAQGERPAFAIDVARLGGMYAGKITLVGTEAGVGVRNAGHIGASAGELVLTAQGRLENSGKLTASGGLRLDSADGVLNTGTVHAQGSAEVATRGDIVSHGLIGALRDTRLKAQGDIRLAGGRIDAGGTLSIDTPQALVTDDATLIAQSLEVRAQALSNRGGEIVQLGTSPLGIALAGELDNTGGRIAANAQDLALAASILRNAGGTIEHAGSGVLALDAGSIDNTSGQLLAEQALALHAREALVNADGLVVAGQALTLDAGSIDNRGGTVASLAQGLDISARAGAIDNEGGQLLAAGALTLATGELDNTSGLIASGAQLALAADAVVNRASGMLAATERLQLAARSLDNRGGRVQAQGDVDLRLASTLDNREGTVAAAEDLSITAKTTLDNSKGQLSAGGALAVQAADAANSGGTLIAGEQLSIDTDRLGGDGSLLSLGNIEVRVTRDYTHTGELRANGNALLETGGSLVNRAGMTAGGRLQLKADAVDNRAEGSLSAGEIQLEAGQALVNRGLIDGRDTFIDAETLRNLGTGRIYGDHVAIKAGALVNQAEGGVAPVIGARERLDIGARTVENREHALIFSAGDMAIGGALDADHRATGSADAVNNASATIESLGAMRLAARTVRNTNEHFSTTVVELPTQQITEYQGAGSPNRYLAGTPGVEVFTDESDHLRTPDAPPNGYESWIGYYYTRTRFEPQVVGSDPAQLLSGGHMRLDADSVLNDKSHIVAGGLIHGTVVKLDNVDGEGERVTTDTGMAISYWRDHRRGRDVTGIMEAPYAPPPLVNTVTLLPTVYRQDETPQGTGTTVAAHSRTSVTQGVQSPGLRALPVLEVPAAGPGRVVRTGGVNTTVPDNRLFSAQPHPGRHYLVETDPRFADYRQWLSSDYLLQAMGLDPAATHKRLGDGFYEQRLLREQMLALTGQRFLEGYADDEAQYRALMASGATFAKEHALRPGVALSAEQMAQLTSDMVWLVEQAVTLPDGSSTRALVPQLYVVVRAGDLQPSGALVAGKNVHLDVRGDLTNTGTIAGRQVLALSADNVHNLGGRIQGADVAVQAATDLNNIGGSISASSSLLAIAGRDLNVQSTVRAEANAQGSRVHIDRVAGLYVTGPAGILQAAAGRDVNLVAAAVVNQSQAPGQAGGATVIVAGRDLNLGTVTESSSQQVAWNAANRRSDASSTEVGSLISTQGDLHLQAQRDINARASSATSEQGALVALAGRDMNLQAGESRVQVDESHQHTSRGLLSKKTITTRDSLDESRALASTFSGATAVLHAERDINVIGSNVVSDRGTLLTAGNDIKVLAATETRSESHTRDVRKSGVSGTGGVGVSMGTQRQSTDTTTVTTTAAASVVGSTQGDVIVRPVNHYRQVGSHVVALEGNIDIEGKHAHIVEARETQRSETETRFKQSGVTLALSNPVVSAVQTAEQMRQSAGDTSDPRMRALAAATVGLAGKNAYDAVQANPGAAGGIDLSVSVGSSRSGSKSTYTADTAYDSTLTAGGNVRVNATGAGQDSNALLRGVQIKAGGDVDLLADNKVRLLASQSASEQHNTHSSSSASLGVSFGTNGLNFSASGSQGRGHADGSEVSWNNARVQAGGTARIKSGGDTEMIGAVVSGYRVVTDIGGRLIMDSPQDTSTYESRQRNVGGSVTVGSRPGGSLSVGGSRIDSTFASVGEQTAIHAGDGGFLVDARQGTMLNGAVITSTQAAHEAGRNDFKSHILAISDIENRAEFKGSGYSVGLGTAANPQGTYAPSGSSVGFGSSSGSASSVSRAGITGIAGDAGVRTGDAETGLQRIFDAEKVQREVDAQVAITRAASAEVPKAVASIAGKNAAALREDAKNESDPARAAELNAEAKKWEEGGAYRIGLHMAAGGLAGGFAGAAGAAAVATAAPLLDALQASVEQSAREAGAGQGVAQGAGSLASLAAATALGAVAGGGSVAGAATALGVDANNRQLHPTEKDRIKRLAGGDAEKEARLTAAACAKVKCYAEYPENSATYQQLRQLADLGASDAFAAERQLLSDQSGMFGYSTSGVLSDANVDAMRQLNNTYQVGVRALGAGQAVLGSAGVAGSLVTAPVSCATGAGCVANAAVGVISIDAAYAGARQLVSGDPEATYLNQGLQSLGMSPEAAAWTEASLGIGAAVKAGGVASKVIDDAIAMNKLGVASYQNFATNGMKVTAEVMETPQARALVKEIQAGNPQLTQSAAEKFAKEYIESGTSLPQLGVAAPGTTLVKAVPKGDQVSPYTGYWLTPQQAQAIATMSPEQAVQVLGLPAAQAAKFVQNGVSFYSITPRAGARPNVFVSEVANTTQGGVGMPGGAQQLIVPNRGLWTEPTPVNPFSLRAR